MAHILTLQSHVVYGYAGNTAAVFPMQRLGHQVSSLNLLQFSNHTGYGRWGGKAISLEELQDVFQGLMDVQLPSQLDAVVTGYIGSAAQADLIYNFISELKHYNPNLLYCCDPVMGDDGRGIYVKPDVATFIKTRLIHLADWITPNAFELSQLSQISIVNRQTALMGSRFLLKNLPNLKGVLATSIANDSNNTGLLLTNSEQVYYCETPKYTLIPTVHGTGDVATAIFISHLLDDDEPKIAMQKTANSLHDITRYTYDHGLKELGIIAMQEAIAHPKQQFIAVS